MLGGTTMKQFKFEYDPNDSHENNFRCWYSENCSERRYFKERVLTKHEAKYVFNKMYGDKSRRLTA